MTGSHWRMPERCDDCPFNPTGIGADLRNSLRRWPQILAGLRKGDFFPCHKTVHYHDDNDSEFAVEPNWDLHRSLVCAGAIEWQDAHGCVANFVQVARRLDERNGKNNDGR